MNTTTSIPLLRRLDVDALNGDAAADAVCPHCGGPINTRATTLAGQVSWWVGSDENAATLRQ
jgi:hypothetical protein